MKRKIIFKNTVSLFVLLMLTVSCGGKVSDPSISSSTDKTSTEKETFISSSSDALESSPFSEKETENVTEKKTEKETTTEEEGYQWTIPEYYRQSLDLTLRKAALKTNLSEIIYPHTAIGYDGLFSAYLKTDLREDGTIWDMYSDVRYQPSEHSGSYSKEGDMYNREHTIPQSVFNKQSTMRCDVFHVYPTDGKINGNRSNYPHAEVGAIKNTSCNPSTNGSKLGTSKTSGVTGLVFEPADEYKGDFARTYFYFVTCYQKSMPSMKDYACFSKNTYPSLSTWAINLYKKWSKEDPVSEKEIKRNEAAYQIQKNRNPFIDFPGIENLIW